MGTENQILILVMLVAVLLGALSINYIFYRRQVAAQQRRLKAKKIQGLLPELLECLSILKQTDCDPKIPKLLENYAAEQLDELTKLAPSQDMLRKLQQSKAEPSVNDLQETANYKRIHQVANKSITVLRTLQSRGKISSKELDDYTHELSLTKLFSEARSLLSIAEELYRNNKLPVAKNQLRQAKGIITKIPDSDARKLQLKNKIESLLNGSSPSTPETSAQPSDSEPPSTPAAEAR